MRSKYLKTVSLLLMLHTPEKGPIKASRNKHWKVLKLTHLQSLLQNLFCCTHIMF